MNSVNHFAVWLSRIIFKTSNGEIKVLYRKLEKTALKIVKNESHRKFNECCLINDLLPTYTNIYIYVGGEAKLSVKLLN